MGKKEAKDSPPPIGIRYLEEIDSSSKEIMESIRNLARILPLKQQKAIEKQLLVKDPLASKL